MENHAARLFRLIRRLPLEAALLALLAHAVGQLVSLLQLAPTVASIQASMRVPAGCVARLVHALGPWLVALWFFVLLAALRMLFPLAERLEEALEGPEGPWLEAHAFLAPLGALVLVKLITWVAAAALLRDLLAAFRAVG